MVFALALGGATASSAAPTAGKSIVGGKFASVSEFPFTAMILKDGKFNCTGSVISPTRILTAAHCATDNPSELSVVTGRSKLSDGGGEAIAVTAILVHPDYTVGKKAIYNDLSIFALATPTSAPPVALPTDDGAFTQPKFPLAAIGYGERQTNLLRKRRAGRLSTAELSVQGNCRKYVKGFDSQTMICALGERFATAYSGRSRRPLFSSACFGDSGGPLISYTSQGPTVFGVTSFGRGSPVKFGFVLCGLRANTGVFMRVAAYLPFIQQGLTTGPGT